MRYLLITLLTVIALLFHLHYYRYCVFQPRINRPRIYWSYKGDLITHISKILWLGVILLFLKWYFVFIPLVILSILKRVAYFKSLNALTKEYMKRREWRSKKDAKFLAKQEMRTFHKQGEDL